LADQVDLEQRARARGRNATLLLATLGAGVGASMGGWIAPAPAFAGVGYRRQQAAWYIEAHTNDHYSSTCANDGWCTDNYDFSYVAHNNDCISYVSEAMHQYYTANGGWDPSGSYEDGGGVPSNSAWNTTTASWYNVDAFLTYQTTQHYDNGVIFGTMRGDPGLANNRIDGTADLADVIVYHLPNQSGTWQHAAMVNWTVSGALWDITDPKTGTTVHYNGSAATMTSSHTANRRGQPWNLGGKVSWARQDSGYKSLTANVMHVNT